MKRKQTHIHKLVKCLLVRTPKPNAVRCGVGYSTGFDLVLIPALL